MTLDEAFIKGASDRFEEVKMASWVKVLQALGRGGLNEAKAAWGAFGNPMKRQMIGNALGAGAGVGGALLTRDDNEGLGTTLGRGLMYGAGGAMLGGMAGRHLFKPSLFKAAPAASAASGT